jgi:hypothetical protein
MTAFLLSQIVIWKLSWRAATWLDERRRRENE